MSVLTKSLPALLLLIVAAAASQPQSAILPSFRIPQLQPVSSLKSDSYADLDAKCGEQADFVYIGQELGNITWDLPSIAASTACCSVASSYATKRSKNSTEGIAWTSTFLGPSKTRKGENTYLCVAYDYGNIKKSGEMNSTVGTTPNLPPLPPPLPNCSTFTHLGRNTCPLNRCYWTDGVGVPGRSIFGFSPIVGCLDSPPIKCGANTPSGADNSPLCIHLRVNDSDVGPITGGDPFNVTVNKNATLKSQVPPTFHTDLWLSIGDGEYHKPEPHLQPFQFCVQYQVLRKGGPATTPEAVAVCITLTGTFDLQVATTKRLNYAAQWHSQNPFVAQVTIGSK